MNLKMYEPPKKFTDTRLEWYRKEVKPNIGLAIFRCQLRGDEHMVRLFEGFQNSLEMVLEKEDKKEKK